MALVSPTNQPPLFIAEHPELLSLAFGQERHLTVAEAATRISDALKQRVTKYSPDSHNPVTAASTQSASCIAYAGLVAGIGSELEHIEEGVLVVSSEAAGAVHCMSSLTERQGPSAIVIDTFTSKLPSTEGDVKPEVLINNRLVTPTFFTESVYGGMSTALDMLAARAGVDGAETVVELIDTSGEFSYEKPGGERTKTVVTGFFGPAACAVIDFCTHGIPFDEATVFVSTMNRFK